MGRDGMIFGIEDPVEYVDNTNMRSTEMTPYSRLIHMIIFTQLRAVTSKEKWKSEPARKWLDHPDSNELADWIGLDMDLIRERIKEDANLRLGRHGMTL